MNSAINLIVSGIIALCETVLRVLGTIDVALGRAMTQAGVTPQHQALVLLVVTVTLIVLALRLLGGLLGLLVIVLLVLLLVQGIAPHARMPAPLLNGPLQNAL
jgi:hypothetical protein